MKAICKKIPLVVSHCSVSVKGGVSMHSRKHTTRSDLFTQISATKIQQGLRQELKCIIVFWYILSVSAAPSQPKGQETLPCSHLRTWHTTKPWNYFPFCWSGNTIDDQNVSASSSFTRGRDVVGGCEYLMTTTGLSMHYQPKDKSFFWACALIESSSLGLLSIVLGLPLLRVPYQ